ncbi:MAG: NAD(P)-dependent oxidoreductase [Thermoproteus sp. AZ2]|jgi:3-hydroxyisobutyrate dehydrogenase|uniref:NAD(P)-dependent oxidoreductase n=1 Tax=Thermoproteus sp. AZ2 TaxID=1609232 RepID=A0ACC6V376_9CREN
MRVGLIGLGVMGWRIAANLAQDGLLSAVFNRTRQKAEEFSKRYGVQAARDYGELAKSADLIITMLSDDEAVKEVVSALLPYVASKIVVDMSTISPETSTSLAEEVRRRGGVMFDAPVIGTSVAVERRAIVVLVGGPKESYPPVEEVLRHTASAVVYVGPNGYGLYAKLVNNLFLGAYLAALAEAFSFGVRAGLSPQFLIDLLTKYSSARSPTSELKAPKLAARDYSVQFAIKHMRKDLEIIQEVARRLKAPVPISALSLQLFRLAEELGLSEEDVAAVYEVLRGRTKPA